MFVKLHNTIGKPVLFKNYLSIISSKERSLKFYFLLKESVDQERYIFRISKSFVRNPARNLHNDAFDRILTSSKYRKVTRKFFKINYKTCRQEIERISDLVPRRERLIYKNANAMTKQKVSENGNEGERYINRREVNVRVSWTKQIEGHRRRRRLRKGS